MLLNVVEVEKIMVALFLINNLKKVVDKPGLAWYYNYRKKEINKKRGNDYDE